jgi:hypothetical protein
VANHRKCGTVFALNVQHDYTRLYECFRALVDAVDTDSAQMNACIDRKSLNDDEERNAAG